ncbi:NTP transferase domain-containing protein, partial [Lysobacter enzymogenes]|uniref:NTP transferase domain-containing protein n=1 Tax=Lysobacter enzymogenes TaxID=69 RepID=UPI0019D0A38A
MRFAAVLLAAGASRRLGRPKQLLRRDGETLLRRGARLALASAAARTVVVLGARADALRGELDGLAVEIVLNPDWQDGMAASLAAAARALAGFDGAVLVLACDQPALELAHLR